MFPMPCRLTGPFTCIFQQLSSTRTITRSRNVATCTVPGRSHKQEAHQYADPIVLAGGWLLACLTSQRHASVSRGRICTDNCTCCHTQIDVAYAAFYLTQSRYADTGPTSPSADPAMPRAWQGSHWSANFEVTGYDSTRKNPHGASGNRTRDLPLSKRTPLPLGQRGGLDLVNKEEEEEGV